MYRRILIVVDADPVSRAAVVEGVELARTQGAEAFFFTVLPTPAVALSAGDLLPAGLLDPASCQRHAEVQAGRILRAAAAVALAQGVASQGDSGTGDSVAACVARAAVERACDLIVVGAPGHSALQRFIHGSLAARLLAVAPVPLLVCRWQGEGPALGGEGGAAGSAPAT
jgi:nucleotide-binding universal stress UspA family protein